MSALETALSELMRGTRERRHQQRSMAFQSGQAAAESPMKRKMQTHKIEMDRRTVKVQEGKLKLEKLQDEREMALASKRNRAMADYYDVTTRLKEKNKNNPDVVARNHENRRRGRPNDWVDNEIDRGEYQEAVKGLQDAGIYEEFKANQLDEHKKRAIIDEKYTKILTEQEEGQVKMMKDQLMLYEKFIIRDPRKGDRPLTFKEYLAIRKFATNKMAKSPKDFADIENFGLGWDDDPQDADGMQLMNMVIPKITNETEFGKKFNDIQRNIERIKSWYDSADWDRKHVEAQTEKLKVETAKIKDDDVIKGVSITSEFKVAVKAAGVDLQKLKDGTITMEEAKAIQARITKIKSERAQESWMALLLSGRLNPEKPVEEEIDIDRLKQIDEELNRLQGK